MEPEQSNGLLDSIQNWLSLGGYPLEYQAEESFYGAGFEVRRGVHFDDEDKGEWKRRETDVVALLKATVHCRGEFDSRQYDRTIDVTLAFIVECKHAGTKKEQADEKKRADQVILPGGTKAKAALPEDREGCQWLAFSTELYHQTDAPRQILPVCSALGRFAACSLMEESEDVVQRLFKMPHRVPFSIVQAFQSKHEVSAAYTALHSVTKAAASLVPEGNAGDLPMDLYIGFPVVITDSPLFECWFEGRPPKDRIEDRSRIRLFWNGSTVTPYTAVDIVTVDDLESYVRQMHQDCHLLIAALSRRLPVWINDIVNTGQFGYFNTCLADLERRWLRQ